MSYNEEESDIYNDDKFPMKYIATTKYLRSVAILKMTNIYVDHKQSYAYVGVV